MSELTKYDGWIKDGGPAALVARELLEPVDGPEGVIFPATYAAAEDKNKFAGGYNIDVFPADERALANAVAAMIRENRFRPLVDVFPDSPNVCLVDSVGAEANRIEPLFGKPTYRHLVPQVVIKASDRSINLLAAGHRAGDALVRFSKAGEVVWDAFQSLMHDGNAHQLAKIAPTSLVFGVWDSRGTQVKVARAFRSVVRAYNVHKFSRSAQFNRATKYVEEGVIAEELDSGDGDKNPLSREGFKDSPATASHGGVVARGEIRRDVTINLSAVRRLRADAGASDAGEADLVLRRYILGLALVAATATTDELFDLREGCQLRQKPGTQVVWRAVPHRGDEVDIPDLTSEAAFRFGSAAAAAFGVGPSQEYSFDKSAAEKWLALKKEEQEKRRRVAPMTLQFPEQAASDAVTTPPAGPRRPSRTKQKGEGS